MRGGMEVRDAGRYGGKGAGGMEVRVRGLPILVSNSYQVVANISLHSLLSNCYHGNSYFSLFHSQVRRATVTDQTLQPQITTRAAKKKNLPKITWTSTYKPKHPKNCNHFNTIPPPKICTVKLHVLPSLTPFPRRLTTQGAQLLLRIGAWHPNLHPST